MSFYAENRRYSPQHDREMVRLSMSDGRSEYWVEIPAEGRQRWRVRKNAALDLIDDAIRRGDQPGECDMSQYPEYLAAREQEAAA